MMRMCGVAQPGLKNEVDFTEDELDALMKLPNSRLKPATCMDYNGLI